MSNLSIWKRHASSLAGGRTGMAQGDRHPGTEFRPSLPRHHPAGAMPQGRLTRIFHEGLLDPRPSGVARPPLLLQKSLAGSSVGARPWSLRGRTHFWAIGVRLRTKSCSKCCPRRGEAMPRPHPVMPRVAHHPEAPPRDLFVPAKNERFGMNDRGRPSGSPLRHPRFCRADSMRSPPPVIPT